MSWVRIDDGMPENLKIEALSDAAFRAYVTSICYAARNLTDGFITPKKAKEFAGKPKVIQELIPHLWRHVDDGYMIHDYLKYNPTRESILEKRAKDSARKSGGIGADSDAPRARDPRPQPLPDPVLDPDPSPPPATPKPPSVEQVLQGRPNIFKLYEALFGKGVSGLIADKLKAYEETHSQECIEHCFQEAAESNARNVKLVYTILDRHEAEGCYAERPGHNQATGNGRRMAESEGLTTAERASLERLGIGAPRVFVMD